MAKKVYKCRGKKLSCGESPNFSGQHLMYNKKLIREIVYQANIDIKDTVLELGAGKGALTTALSQKAGKVLAVENDSTFVEILKRKTAQNSNTKIIHQDIMKIHLPNEKFVVISNIPYAITTPIMKMLLNNPASGFQKGIIVMEKGAAKRFTSKFIKNSYVLAWRMWFDISIVREISKDNFSPPPKVDSAMVRITRKKEAPISHKHYITFFGLAEYALKKPQAPFDFALRGIFTPLQMKHLRKNLKINNEKPIGTLNENQWAVIFKTMTQHVMRHNWPRAKKGKRKRAKGK
ncbi:23S ribosomal RNA methyltransferase Erm [Bacillus sonorensis]|uniref:23S ribosomal RNA methyltransferase Erm n=1 Tax=Bacillus sonorensis TaxID=119858 RepID=UPI000495B1E4|nr:23S ribosomal RNA methyltransferase Erm [Bacillus sonorensis]MBG9916081.1 rRNA adenine methyltransferase [Bacillus sonorensis]MCF7617622.1 23S ribosomal RNA methyltransferase Erm [Bacillus sonorensis]MCY8025931.1 23S ribosomal RNA methyltransferase Erm [Bacillus sonorensis]MCY8034934.1 23S ribosomal RNA methyltransferase Erm [Bacillus sonorensis]MCY8088145.1 23S ribosomal RNA methyltransferase Erm [Bacillus sonorensis]